MTLYIVSWFGHGIRAVFLATEDGSEEEKLGLVGE